MTRCVLWIVVILAATSVCMRAFAGQREYRLGEFDAGWNDQWREKRLAKRANRYEAVLDGQNRVLEIRSDASASGLVREIVVEPLDAARLSWRWKISGSLAGNDEERRRSGDDYAARVCVVYDTHFLPWKTRSVCYVWAGEEGVGETYPNPYSGSVGTIVLQSGDESANQWVRESRDVVADYEHFFSETPPRLTAVAIIVDTDQTEASVSAWFDDVVLRVVGPAVR